MYFELRGFRGFRGKLEVLELANEKRKKFKIHRARPKKKMTGGVSKEGLRRPLFTRTNTPGLAFFRFLRFPLSRGYNMIYILSIELLFQKVDR